MNICQHGADHATGASQSSQKCWAAVGCRSLVLLSLSDCDPLSLVNALNHISVIAAHALFLFTLLLLIRPRGVPRISLNLHTLVIGLLSSLVFLQGLFSAPNTTDSLVYHLPRIMYWLQGRSVLQSQIFYRARFFGPLRRICRTAFLFAHQLRYARASQWLVYLGMILTTMKIAGQLGVPAASQQFVGLLFATIPMAVLQASSTQVDLVTTFLFLLSIHFALQLREHFSLASISLVAITAALGILTKATMLIFALVPAGIVLKTISKSPGRTQKLLYASIQIVALAVILGPFLIQNERLYQSLLGRHQTPRVF